MKEHGKSTGSKKIDTERETRVLLKRMSSDMQKIAEAQSSTGTQIAEIKATVNDLLPLKSEVKIISMAVMTLGGDVKKLTADVSELKGSMAILESKVDKNLTHHENRITKLEEKISV